MGDPLHYDPIKYNLAKIFGKSKILRRLFFLALDLLFLRAWYIRRELRRLKSGINNQQSAISNQQLTILDAGMGFGQYSDRMMRMFSRARLIGLEIDRDHLYGSEEYFRKVHPTAQIVTGDVQQLPLRSDRFDLILSVDVMEHIEDDAAAFLEYARVLKPGGYFLMHTPRIIDSAPPFDSPPAERGGSLTVHPAEWGGSVHAADKHWSVDEHLRDGYGDDEARSKLEKAGLEIVRIVRGYGIPGRIAWTLLQRIPLKLLNMSKIMILPVTLYLIITFPFALILMWLDMLRGDNPAGASLLVVAQRAEQK